MVTVVSMEQGMVLRVFDRPRLRDTLSPSVSACLCSDPSHGNSSPALRGRNESFLSHANHYLRVIFRLVSSQMYTETDTKIVQILVHLLVLK